MKTIRIHLTIRALSFITLFACLLPRAQAAGNPGKTQQLIAVLQSNAGLRVKARACEQLGEIGTKEAVPALASLLGDEHLSAYARSGLEGIANASAAEALRTAAGTLKGNQLIGVVNSLGVLRDTNAIGILRQLAGDPTSGAAKEALFALGRISTRESIQIIRRTLANGSAEFRADAASACLLAAERQMADGRSDQAMALYDAVRTAKVPLSYRVGATRGAILARQGKGISFLVEQLRSEDHAIRNAALLTIREMPSDKLASALNAELAQATPELQNLLLTALVACHNPRSFRAIEAKTASDDPEIRQTALVVLGQIGGPAAARRLLQVVTQNRNARDASIALDALKRMEGKSINGLVLKALHNAAGAEVRVQLIGLIEARDLTNATAELLKLAATSDQPVSRAALGALATLAGPKDLPALIALDEAVPDDSVREAVEGAIIRTCTRTKQSPVTGEAVLAKLKQSANPKLKNSWIRILAALGYAEALPTIEEATAVADATVSANAIRQLGRWPDPAPVKVLLPIAEGTPNPDRRELALDSVVQLATVAAEEHQRPETVILGWLQRADKAAPTVEVKRRILSALGRLKQMESFRLAAAYLDDPEVQTEAAQALVQIAPTLVNEGDTEPIKEAMEKISAKIQNPNIRNRAAKITRSIPKQSLPKALFDGKTLKGWEGNTNVWRVRDGVIVGGSMTGNRQNEFLATTSPYRNFVLRLEYKLVGTQGFINSGVQFRSVRIKRPANEMSGYQADIGAGYSGSLYDESRRRRFLVRASEAQIKRLEKPGDWNRYEVRCAGPRLQILLNGEKTVDYTEPDPSIPQTGLIALQMHGGNKAQVSFRNLTIAKLSYGIAARDFGVPKTKWKVISCDSQNTEGEDERAVLAIDDNPDTFWHTLWNGGHPGHPHHLTVDFGEPLQITGFTYLPRQDGRAQAGVIGEYEFFLSQDGKDWAQPVARGRFERIVVEPTGRVVILPRSVPARFLKLVSLSAPGNQPYAGAAEVGVLGRPVK